MRELALTRTQEAGAERGEALYHELAAAPPMSMGSLVASAWRHWLLFALTFGSLFAAAGVVIMSLRPSFQSEATLMIDPRQSHLTNLQSIQEGSATLSDLNFVRTEMQVLAGDGLAQRVVTKLDLQDEPLLADPPSPIEPWLTRFMQYSPVSLTPMRQVAHSIEEMTARYKERFGTFSDGKSFIISAWFNAPDPVLAQRILQTHLDLFQAAQIADKRATIARAEQWFDHELDSLQAKLVASEIKQQAFREHNQLFRAAGETTSSRQLVSITNQLAAARSDLASKEARVREISSGKGRPDTASLSSDLLQKLREQEAAEAQQVAQMSQRYDASHPMLIAARAALADIDSRISRETQRIAAAAASDTVIARTNVAQLENAQNALTTQFSATSQGELMASQLEREVDADRRLYDDLLARSKQVGIQEQLQEPDTRIVSDASLPLKPTFPRKGMLLTISAAAAALLAATAAAVADRFSSGRSRTVPDIERATGLAALATIPRVRGGRHGLRLPLKPGTILAASLQTLHNSISLRTTGGSPETTVFASALPGEGKSLLALLYARTLASSGHRVLLVDADLRRAGLSRMLKLAGATGTNSFLSGQPLNECVKQNVLPGLDIMPAEAGRGDPAALLTDDRLRALGGSAIAGYTAVIIDVPPILAVDDCVHFVKQAQSTVLVVRSGRTHTATLTSAIRRLRLARANLVGVAVNGANTQTIRSGTGLQLGTYLLAR